MHVYLFWYVNGQIDCQTKTMKADKNEAVSEILNKYPKATIDRPVSTKDIPDALLIGDCDHMSFARQGNSPVAAIFYPAN
jgi:hypothetical protein